MTKFFHKGFLICAMLMVSATYTGHISLTLFLFLATLFLRVFGTPERQQFPKFFITPLGQILEKSGLKLPTPVDTL